MTRLSDAFAELFGQFWRQPRTPPPALSPDEREARRVARDAGK